MPHIDGLTCTGTTGIGRFRMRKTWTAPTLQDFNVGTRKRPKVDVESCETTVLPEPKTVADLTVNPRKVAEVRKWVAWCLSQQSPILLIHGPAGTGKTVTLRLVAESEGLSVVEWITPATKTIPGHLLDEGDGEKAAFYDTSEGKKFEDFITRSSRYPSLFQPAKRTLILVKDVPNSFVWKPDLFHGFLEKYRAHGRSPIVFIVTDDENLDLHGALFPSELKTRLSVDVIKFNPVSDMYLRKNLRALTGKFKSRDGPLTSESLERIAKNSCGDLRSAITDVFMELRTNDAVNKKKSKKRKLKSATDDESEKPKAQSVSSRDHGYDFYKKMGRILYPKRAADGDDPASAPGQFVHDVNAIAETWSRTYLSFLHENYLQTCGRFVDATESASLFSFCDVWSRHRDMEPYLSLVTAAGLMLSNTQPKKSGFLPFKRSTNLDAASTNWRCRFGEAAVARFGVVERNFALDVAPLKNWLPENGPRSLDNSVRTLGGGPRADRRVPTPSASQVVPDSVSNASSDSENDDGDEDNLEIEDDDE